LKPVSTLLLTPTDCFFAKNLECIPSYIVKPVKRSELLNTIGLAVRKTQTLTKEPIREDLPNNREDIDLLNILLVEDYIYNRIVVQSYLKNSANIDIAENGKIGVEKFKLKKYDILLMDLQMPVQNKAGET
jgi:DNA-binding response OmpR family regulator